MKEGGRTDFREFHEVNFNEFIKNIKEPGLRGISPFSETASNQLVRHSESKLELKEASLRCSDKGAPNLGVDCHRRRFRRHQHRVRGVEAILRSFRQSELKVKVELFLI